jgi:hypothetical protein
MYMYMEVLFWITEGVRCKAGDMDNEGVLEGANV